MIVYNVLEEVRIIIYLLVFGIYVFTSYDILNIFKCRKKFWNNIIVIIGSLFIICTSYMFVCKLKKGYIPQYGLLFVFIGLAIYYVIFREKMMKMIKHIRTFLMKILSKLSIIMKPFKVFKTTFLQIKQKIKKLNIKTLYKKKKL